MGGYDTTLGALLMGVLINTYLYGLTTSQYGTYFNAKFEDPQWMRVLIGVLLCIDTVHSASLIYLAWVYLIANFGDATFIMYTVWPLPFSAIIVSVIAWAVQNFLALRIYRLLGRKWLLYVFVFLSTGTMILGFVLGVKIMMTTYLAEFMSLKPQLTTWLTMEVVLDTAIAVILFVALQQSRTGFRRSDAVLNRLGRCAIQSGVFTSILAILALGCFLALPETLFYGTFGMPIARAYTYSLLDTLICRKEIRGILNGTGDTRGSVGSVPTIFGRGDQWPMQLHGIRKEVHTEVRFEEDPPPVPSVYSGAKDRYIVSPC